MNKLVYILLLLSISQACPTQKIQCGDLITQIECSSTIRRIASCKWDNNHQSCYVDSASCAYHSNKEDCQRTYCDWIDEECRSKIQQQQRSCDQNLTYSSCVSRSNYVDCSWVHDKCIPIYECKDANEIHNCRRIRVNERYFMIFNRCVVVRNGKADSIEESQFKNLLPQIFEDIQCRSLDCVYNYNEICPSFVNGRRCFKDQGNCTQCSYFTSKKNCIKSNQCTWQGGCRNILCSDFTTKSLCLSKSYCQFNEQIATCETRSDHYCYYYDIGSDPKKSNHIDL